MTFYNILYKILASAETLRAATGCTFTGMAQRAQRFSGSAPARTRPLAGGHLVDSASVAVRVGGLRAGGWEWR